MLAVRVPHFQRKWAALANAKHTSDGSVAPKGTETVDRVSEHAGQGIVGFVNGCEVRVGRLEFVTDHPLANISAHWQNDQTHRGRSVVMVSIDGQLAGGVAFEDSARGDAKFALDTLSNDGWKSRVVSGDTDAAAKRLGQQLGI